MPEVNPSDLIARTRSGDRASLEELVARYIEPLHGYLRLRCGPALRQHESSMDLVQSVCREVLERDAPFEYRGEGAFRNWLFLAAEHKVRDRIRYWGRAKREGGRQLADEASSSSALSCFATFCTPSHGAIAREQVERIERAFDELDDTQRQIILLSRLVGLTYDEIAAQIGQSPHYTRTLLSRGLARLSTLLDRTS